MLLNGAKNLIQRSRFFTPLRSVQNDIRSFLDNLRLLSCDLRLMLPLLHVFCVSAFWIPLIGGIPESGTDVVYRDEERVRGSSDSDLQTTSVIVSEVELCTRFGAEVVGARALRI